MWEIAEEFQALLVFAEHRYYGESLPYGAESFSDKNKLGYLTSQQALADYVDLITYLKIKNHRKIRSINSHVYDTAMSDDELTLANPVIAFGGSYGGMLSAWIRMKYPAVVEG